MRKIQSKLLGLSLACITCIVFFAVLAVRAAYVKYIGLSNFQVISQVSTAVGVLAENITNERQDAYNAITFSGNGNPDQLLEAYRAATATTGASLQRVSELAAANRQRFSASFQGGLEHALEAEAPLDALRQVVLDPSRPKVQDMNSPLKTKALGHLMTTCFPPRRCSSPLSAQRDRGRDAGCA